MPNKRSTRPTKQIWSERLQEPGWLLLPLRGFLGVTFTFAGLQKLANPDYLNAHSPTSVVGQMRLLQHSSPIGPLISLSTHAPTLVGLLIAFGELAVGLGTLLGLYQRAAAVGGAVLSLTFFLTVSWNTSPYYYGSDIVFVFAWLTLFGFGTGGVLSLDAWLRDRARATLRLGPQPASVRISADRLHALCPRAGQCGLRPDGQCHRLRGCPVFPPASTCHRLTVPNSTGGPCSGPARPRLSRPAARSRSAARPRRSAAPRAAPATRPPQRDQPHCPRRPRPAARRAPRQRRRPPQARRPAAP